MTPEVDTHVLNLPEIEAAAVLIDECLPRPPVTVDWSPRALERIGKEVKQEQQGG